MDEANTGDNGGEEDDGLKTEESERKGDSEGVVNDNEKQESKEKEGIEFDDR